MFDRSFSLAVNSREERKYYTGFGIIVVNMLSSQYRGMHDLVITQQVKFAIALWILQIFKGNHVIFKLYPFKT